LEQNLTGGKMSQKVTNEFVSTLSHEIRTPLTSIKGFSQTMLENWDNLNDEQKRKFLGIISEQSERLIKLVENVLNVAKLEGEDEPVIREIDLVKIAENTIALVKMSHKGRVFNLHAQNKVPRIMADYDKLQQVLTNILENACKYSEKDISVNILNSGKIEVTDLGAGISEADLTRIFEKFYRAQNYLTSKVQGSGLGLYIAKSLMAQMNGNIDVASSNNKTTFTLTLPVYEPEKLVKKVKNV
jgi:signal transduction histidine kinase